MVPAALPDRRRARAAPLVRDRVVMFSTGSHLLLIRGWQWLRGASTQLWWRYRQQGENACSTTTLLGLRYYA